MMNRSLVQAVVITVSLSFFGCQGHKVIQAIGPLPDSKMAIALGHAMEKGDRLAAREMAEAVMLEILERTYRYGYDTRRNAGEAISDLKLRELAPLVRRVAEMPYEPQLAGPLSELEQFRRRLDVIAIEDALVNLVALEDVRAVELNRARLEAPLVRRTAINNLAVLQDWDSTDTIRDIAGEIESGPETLLDFWAITRFLYNSPQSRSEDCSLVRRLMAEYGQCFDAEQMMSVGPGCAELSLSVRQLEARLGCESSEERWVDPSSVIQPCSGWEETGEANPDWARAVLEDSLRRTYCASLDERRSAFDYLESSESGELIPLVVQVASMDYGKEKGTRQTLDIISIMESLRLLTEIKNPNAAALNLSRLDDDPWLQSSSISNLAQIEHWAATREIEELLARTEVSEDLLLAVGNMLFFLGKSPLTDPSVCKEVVRVHRAYSSCVKDAVSLRCRDLVDSLAVVESRFGCAPVGEPGVE